MSDEHGALSRVVRFYFRVVYYLLIAVPLMAGILILVAFMADGYSKEGDCSLTEAALDFLGTAVKWYAGVLGAVILAIPRLIARRPSPPDN